MTTNMISYGHAPRVFYCSARDAKENLPSHNPAEIGSFHVQFPCGRPLADFLQSYAPKASEHYDVYYDDPKKKLMANKFWLRFRDQQDHTLKYEVKLGIEDNTTPKRSVLDPTCKRADEQEVDDIATVPYAFIPFIRYEFDIEKLGCKIHLDEAKISEGDYYVIGTIRIQTEEERKAALSFLVEYGLDTGPVHSKVVEWLRRRNTVLYKELVNLKIVEDLGLSDVGHFNSPPIGRDNVWFENYASILRGRDANNPY